MSAFWELVVVRVRQTVRERGQMFWMFVFPLLVAVVLGFAFRGGNVAKLAVAVVDGPGAERVESALRSPDLVPRRATEAEATEALRAGRIALVVYPDPLRFVVDKAQPEGRTARLAAADALRRALDASERPVPVDEIVTRGERYLDFLFPGLLGMNLLSAAMWGLAMPTFAWRRQKFFKRLASTPASRASILGASVATYALFGLAFTVTFLLMGRLLFDFVVAGPVVLVLLLAVVGISCLASMALFCASFAEADAVCMGLIHVCTFPQMVCGGVFFSQSRFPSWLQMPARALPLSMLNDAFRAVALEGAGVVAVLPALGGLLLWGTVAFAVTLKVFRWT